MTVNQTPTRSLALPVAVLAAVLLIGPVQAQFRPGVGPRPGGFPTNPGGANPGMVPGNPGFPGNPGVGNPAFPTRPGAGNPAMGNPGAGFIGNPGAGNPGLNPGATKPGSGAPVVIIIKEPGNTGPNNGFPNNGFPNNGFPNNPTGFPNNNGFPQANQNPFPSRPAVSDFPSNNAVRAEAQEAANTAGGVTIAIGVSLMVFGVFVLFGVGFMALQSQRS